MPVPSNTTAGTALVISSLPYSNSQQVDDGVQTYTVWYEYTTIAGTLGIGFYPFEDPDLNNWNPKVDVFEADGVTPFLNISAVERRIRFGTGAAVKVYFRVSSSASVGFPHNLTVNAYAHPTDTVASGDVLVNDDSPGFPGILIRPDGSVRNLVYPLPAGEAGDILEDGSVVLNDFDTDALEFFDNQFNAVATVAWGSSDPRIRTCIGAQLFYVGERIGGVTTIKSYNASGVEQSSRTLAGNPPLISIAAKNDESEIYLADNNAGSDIRVFNLTTGVEGSILVSGIAGRWIPDILVLPDGTLIFSSVNQVLGDINVYHYSAAGALLNTYNFSSDSPAFTFPRLAYEANNGENSFWIWTHEVQTTGGISRFREVKVSDGSILTDFTMPEYEAGVYQPAADGEGDFGVSFSCPFIVMGDNNTITTTNTDQTLFTTTPGTIGGLYKLSPGLTHDTLWTDLISATENVKIP